MVLPEDLIRMMAGVTQGSLDDHIYVTSAGWSRQW